MADRRMFVDALLGLRDFVGDPPRWGAEVTLPAFAADPPNMLVGEKVANLASLQLPAPMPLTIRWGTWKPAPFAIPGLTLPVGGGGRFGPDVSAGGITHHDAYRVLVEWGVPNGIALRQWIGPNAPYFLTTQQLTLTLYRFKRTQSTRQVKCFVGLGHHPVIYKCVNSTRATPNALAQDVWTQLVGSNWARRGGYVSNVGATQAWVAFTEMTPSVPLEGWRLSPLAGAFPTGPETVPIPLDWCGPVWAVTNAVDATLTVTEHWVAPPEMEPWGQTP